MVRYSLFAESFENSKTDYSKFKVIPDYIRNPSDEDKEYFRAYDRTMNLWETSYEELYIPTSHGIAHVIVSGSGNQESLVLFHGLGSSSTMWHPNIKKLSENFQVFAIDLIIEPGKSRLRKEFHTIGEVSGWYQEVISRLNLSSYHLVGPSRGGWFALDLTVRFPENLKSTILISPVQSIIWTPLSAGLLKNLMNIFYPGKRQIARTMTTLSNKADTIETDFLEQYRLGKKMNSSKKFLTAMRPFKRKELKTISVPVLLLTGDSDLFNNRKSIVRGQRYISGFSGMVVKNSGHFISVDQPEVLHNRMLEFIRRNSA